MERALIVNMLSSTVSSGTNSTAQSVELYENFSILNKWTDATPSAVNFAPSAVNITTEKITIVAHGLVTGSVIQFSTTGTLPAGLSLSTNYYAVKIDANTIQVADSLAHALAATPVIINITDQGSGTHTETATALANAAIKLQGSFDNSFWFDIDSGSVTITGNSSNLWEYSDCEYNWIRTSVSLDSGVLTISSDFSAKLFAGS